MIRTKRWNDPVEKDADGVRILVCRYRPRALPKKDETWDRWIKILGPSKDLHAAYYGKNGPPLSWDEFEPRYLEEMTQPEEQAQIDALAQLAASGQTLTLLCSTACTDEKACHRSLLRRLVEQRLAQLQAHPLPEP